MNPGIVFSQMLIILVLMLTGLFLCKIGIISKESSKDFSGVVVNICAPMQLIMSVLNNSGNTADRSDLIRFFGFSIVAYFIMILFGYVVNTVLKIPKNQRNDYQLMTVFGNCGFIGIPVAQALFGSESLIYVAVFNLTYNLVMYTYGLWIIASDMKGISFKEQCLKFINPGTVFCLVTILIFWFQIRVPVPIQSLCAYAGQPATFLALVVIGISLSEMKFKELFGDWTMFIFVIIRFIIFPVVFVSIIRIFIGDVLIRGTLALMISVPVGNMPAMMRTQFGQDDRLVAKGAVVTTVFSVVTITITCLFI